MWQCSPGEFSFRRDGYDEVFCVLSGRATLHIDGAYGPGQSFELVPGSVILTPAGLTGRWVVHETIRKAYGIVIAEPAVSPAAVDEPRASKVRRVES